MAKVSAKFIEISCNGYSIASNEYMADIELNTGGDNSEVTPGIGGYRVTVEKFDAIDTLTIAVGSDTATAYRLEEYYSTVKQCDWIIKDNNPARQRSWTGKGQVKSFDTLKLNGGDGYAFTVEFESRLKLA